MQIIRLLEIISEHKQKKSKGQLEVVVLLADGDVVTRHVRPSDIPASELAKFKQAVSR